MSLKLFWHKLIHWEYWPLRVIYYPLFPVWLYLSIKARSFFFFNAANPSMKNGGMAMESKMDIYQKIASKFIPKTILIQKGTAFTTIIDKIRQKNIEFPCIAKPDVGMKSFGVEKIYSENQLKNYLNKNPFDFLIQELIPYTNEVGVFYIRMPNDKKGKISGIVHKDFLAVTGDGTSTLTQLIKKDPRSHMQLKKLRHSIGEEGLQKVLDKGERYVLVPYGSHTRGAKFVDVTHKNNPQLEELMNHVCTQIDGFYYGRLDILYDTFEDLSLGKNFSIIEVNGAGSEATHIYDPKHSLFFAWREIIKHWSYLCTISIENHKKGYPYLSYKAGKEMLKLHNEHEARIQII
ncbi:D-alanine--D-alanine ligase [Maribacter sp. 2304DJ31-5]|uniref:D-alanine--D-alanine ligase n=1 Tax=Maribacter sp. 2304DJ31-5 TaxID=3386273 RepID=UPI0039BC9E4D